MLRGPPEHRRVLTLALWHGLRRSVLRYSPDYQAHESAMIQRTLQFVSDHPDFAAAFSTWAGTRRTGTFFGSDWGVLLAQATVLSQLDPFWQNLPLTVYQDLYRRLSQAQASGVSQADRIGIMTSLVTLPDGVPAVGQIFIENYSSQEQTQSHIYFIQTLPNGLKKVVRISPANTKDWLATDDTSRSLRDENLRVDIVRNTDRIASDVVAERELYAKYPQLLEAINAVNGDSAEGRRHAISRFQEWAEADDEATRDLRSASQRILFGLSLTDRDHDERVRLNRYVFDRVTERPEAFPPATFNYSAFDSTGYAVRIPFHKRPHQVRILWSVNGNPVQQSDALHPVTLNNSHLEYRWQVPVQEGWVHYAVQVQDRPGGRWRYLRSPSDSRDPRARANGLIKFQQDVRGRRVASIRPETFNLRLENLRPMVDSQGNILVGTLADLKAQLQSIKEQGYGEIYLQVLEPGAAGEAGPDESSFSPLDQIHISARIGGLKGLLELKKIADELDLEISLDMVPHLSRSNREVVPRMPVWIVEPETGRLVRRAASDGGLTEEWRDSFARNWADARNVQDYIAQLSELARLGFNFRVDVAHVFDTTFETDPETVGMARIAGQVVTENTEEVMFLGQRRRVFKTNDLRFTEEPNSVLAWIIYEVKKAGFEQGHQTKFYGENWHGHEARLIQSGIDFPFDPVLMNVWHMVREGYPSDECTQTLRYLTDIQQRFGGGTVTLQNNHDAQVAAVDAFGDSAFAAISTLAFVSGGVSFEHFHYAYPSWDGSIDWEQVAGDTGRVPTFNFGAPRVVHQRFWPGYSWEAKVRRTSDELDRNPYFRGLGGHLRRVTDLTRRYPPPPISLNVGHHRVVGVARRGGPDEFLIMLSHLGSSFAADINFHPNDERQDGHGLGEFDDNAVYEFAEVYNNENVSVDEDHPGDQMILTGREITHLGMGPRYPLPILGTRIYRFRKISDNIPQVRTPQYRALLEDSIQRYRRYGPRERFWHSFVTDEIIHALTLTEPQENMTVEQTRRS
ncbi:MAG: hypothetical protein PHN49_08595, partial [Candidatus Omnitrophica bacterium]|nr:hypothetical protein [Candidatus Omnitrophota bacterium]